MHHSNPRVREGHLGLSAMPFTMGSDDNNPCKAVFGPGKVGQAPSYLCCIVFWSEILLVPAICGDGDGGGSGDGVKTYFSVQLKSRPS